MSEPDKFTPRGRRLPLPQLEAIATVTEKDVTEAMRKAHKDLKPFLNAQ